MSKYWSLNGFDMTCVVHQSPGLWRHPDDQSYRYTDIDYWTNLAQLLERGKFDSLFIADVLGVYDVYKDGTRTALREGAQIPVGDPLLAVSAMAAVTKHLGFALTVSSTYEQPYSLARKFTTLDHLTKGRVGWNVVTSYLESQARNLGLRDGQLQHEDRYGIADEFLEVAYKLWEGSWDDDAVIRDTQTGVYVDPDKVRPIDHHGKHFDVPGVFLSEPSPQRSPVIFQAGASSRGKEFAAKHAEGIFVQHFTPELLATTVSDIRHKAEKYGRDPRSINFLAKITIVTGENDEAAHAKFHEYQQYASYDGALTLFGGWAGIDLSTFKPDEPLKYFETDAIRSAVESVTRADPNRVWTPRDIAANIGVGGMGPTIVGGPQKVADELEEWITVADIEGFNIAYAITPGSFEDLVTYLVPELQKRGVHRREYEGTTLRENLYGVGHKRLRDDHYGARFRDLSATNPSDTTKKPSLIS